MRYIGKLNIEKLGKYRKKIITDEVILTEERIKHIQEHHPGDYEKYGIYIKLGRFCFPKKLENRTVPISFFLFLFFVTKM